MARMIREVVSLLNGLIQLDYDAIEAGKAAVAQVSDGDDRARLVALLGERRRQVDEIALVVRNLGGEPANHGDLRQVTPRGKVVLGALSGERAMLDALESTEDAVIAGHERAASQPGVPMDVLALLERHLAAARARREWIGEHLAEPPASLRA